MHSLLQKKNKLYQCFESPSHVLPSMRVKME